MMIFNNFDTHLEPPTLYAILNSIVNFDQEKQTKIVDLAKKGRTKIFDFNYPLSDKIKREEFEVLILNNFLMRRINFETVTAFKIKLFVKLNEIMPKYNKMFDSFVDWNLFEDGDILYKIGDNNHQNNSKSNTNNKSNTENIVENESQTNTNSIDDLRFSDTPQNILENLHDGSYVTQANYNQGSSESENNSKAKSESVNESETENKTDIKEVTNYTETIKHSNADKIGMYKEMQENINNIYTLIFKDLEILFYQILD